MTDIAIKVQGVYKRYRQNETTLSLRHEFSLAIKRVLGMVATRPEHETFFALKDISLEIKKGEAVALVGRNGSGKTTLLRILSKITRPTEGKVEVKGRFSSLIALGAGFNPEMSGRRNIYLNAAIFGLRPSEVEPIIDDIINFSEIEEFIDLPVKRYSSGMYARLGFSIAVHIFPDIMFVDEVLSVGDSAFQRKCIERIQKLKAEGLTIVLVSHAEGLVEEICERAIWLHRGALMMDGFVQDVIPKYLDFLEQQAERI